MAVVVRLTNKSQGTRTQANKLDENSILLSRSIYQRLGSLVNAKKLSSDYNNELLPKEFKAFLDELDKVGSGEETDSIILTNQYLSSLGMTETYPYSKDIRAIPLWIETVSQEEYRELWVHVDNIPIDQLIDVDTGDILVHFTGE